MMGRYKGIFGLWLAFALFHCPFMAIEVARGEPWLKWDPQHSSTIEAGNVWCNMSNEKGRAWCESESNKPSRNIQSPQFSTKDWSAYTWGSLCCPASLVQGYNCGKTAGPNCREPFFIDAAIKSIQQVQTGALHPALFAPLKEALGPDNPPWLRVAMAAGTVKLACAALFEGYQLCKAAGLGGKQCCDEITLLVAGLRCFSISTDEESTVSAGPDLEGSIATE